MSHTDLQTRTVHVLITGRVQGVFYRAWTEETARGLGLDGWVRNRRDGSVEAVFSGAKDSVSEMLRLCRQGPGDAAVENIEILQEGGGAPAGFEVRETA